MASSVPVWPAWHPPAPAATPRAVRANPASGLEAALAGAVRTQQQRTVVVDLTTRRPH